MQGEDIQRIAIKTAERLTAAACSYPFGPAHQVYKVCGKVFLLLTTLRGEPIITLKCQPQQAELHRTIYPSITAGYHMNKRLKRAISNAVSHPLPAHSSSGME